MSQLLSDFITAALTAQASGNSYAAVAAAAVLWPDKERQWEAAMPALMKRMPNLLMLGSYDVLYRRGPAVWLKCAIAGALPEVPFEGVPVIYLPGVSRTDLRAIESCPRDLQPLAELQYRGVFWSQVNGKDWTLTAFLSSKNGGLGLDVAQDKATQEALGQALRAGVLLGCSIEELKGRSINAEWLMSLLAPNPTRDLLLWMNEPDTTPRQWGEVLWDVFVKRCKSDFGFDPVADGVLSAAEHLAKAKGKWEAVAELYRDAFASFPNVFSLLLKVKPPQQDLFSDQSLLAGYPKFNEQRETTLRNTLRSCSGLDVTQARKLLLDTEQEHGVRRTWLWAAMGHAPMAVSLEHLARVAHIGATLPIGNTPTQLAESYQQVGWQVDQAAMKALACVRSKADVEAVGAALRAVYLPWLEEAANRLQGAVKTAGGLPQLPLEKMGEVGADTCTVFVDGLRYDVAIELQKRLSELGNAELAAAWTSLPSVTASGKAWCSPVAEYIAGTPDDVEFAPRVAADGKPLSGHNFRKLLAEHGVQALDKQEVGEPNGMAWTEAGDLDHYGHSHGLRLASDLDMQLDQIIERVCELRDAGWRRIRVVTDHGWLLMPGGLPKSELSKREAETRWGRCAVLKDNAHGTSLTFGWDWCKQVQVAYAPGVSSFVAGAEYAHGGISFQECLVPILRLECANAGGTPSSVTIQSIIWKGLRCVVTFEGDSSDLSVDLRTRAAVPSTSLVVSPKPIEGGKANLAVGEDDQIGHAAVVVVLGPEGEILQKQATTVGG